MLSQAGVDGPFALTPIHGGANSKAFRVELAGGGPTLFFKQYFRHAQDPRDRLATEYAFASFAWDCGLWASARPYVMDRELGCALYSFLDGCKLTPGEITAADVGQCLAFFHAINAQKQSPQAARLPIAAEACFSLADHWECLRRRLHRLEAMAPGDAVERQALAFVVERLAPAASAYWQWACSRAGELGLSCTVPIDDADRCLSPSDFGFHNALKAPDGALLFLDFEYAGWDDPAKTVCDFFCQPACPVPLNCWDAFAGAIAHTTTDPDLTAQRFTLLLPMYRLKWCCIMLNDFLPAGAGRRRFALHDLDEAKRKERQLTKAQDAWQQYHAAWPANQAA